MSPASDPHWWKRTTVYQIYPRSFADSNGDGIGDLRGVLGKLDYLQSLGVETLWLSPFFQSPQADFGYDISDYKAISPDYGTLADCNELIKKVHARGMKLVFDMVLNHTSDQHPWFLSSRSSSLNNKRDWYLWRDGRQPHGKSPPNNWRSMLGGSGWHYDANTGQWYFASFLANQPDLNYRNPEVKQAMLGIVSHWLDAGADGLRLDIFNALFKDASFADNPFSCRPVPTESNPHGFFQKHIHTIDHPDTIAFALELRAVVDRYHSPERFLVGEVFGDAAMLKRYCGDAAQGLHLVFLFESLRAHASGPEIRALISEFEASFPAPYTPTYVYGNHDRPRLALRIRNHEEKAKLLAAIQLTVRGVPFIYYGEEIGMENHDIPLHEGLDPVAARFRLIPQFLVRWLRRRGVLLNRDECRSPMQWTAGPNAGFAAPSAKPWLPIHPNHLRINVATQSERPDSLLNCYRALLALRRELPALQAGALEWIEISGMPRSLVAFRRTIANAVPGVDVFLNFSSRACALDLSAQSGRTLFSSRDASRIAAPREYQLAPHEAVILFGEALQSSQ